MDRHHLRVTGIVISTILLTLLTQQVARVQGLGNTDSCQTFRETGKTVCGSFLNYWQQHGGLPIFGYPISVPIKEQSSLDGKTYTVQYFERAIFEYHPENTAPYDVLLSQLGTYRFQAQYPQGDPGEPYTDQFPRYPKAENVEIKQYQDGVHPDVVMTYVAPAMPTAVLAFYKDVLGKAGWENPLPQRDPNTLYFVYSPKQGAGPEHELSIIVSLLSNNRTKVEIDYNRPGCC